MNGLPDTTPTNRAGPRWFVRVVAVVVGLVNPVVLTYWFSIRPDLGLVSVWEAVQLSEALALVLVAVLSGLATAEIILRRFGRWVFSERFVQRYAAAALGICLGGILLGGTLGAVAAFPGFLVSVGFLDGPYPLGNPLLLALRAALFVGIIGVVVGGVLGLLESVILALPLAHILGRFSNEG